MPSRRSPLTVTRRELLAGAALLVAALNLAGCAATRPPAPQPPSTADSAFLLPAATGNPLTVDPQREARLDAAQQALVARGDVATAESTAKALLAEDPGLHAAQVLLAQARFVVGDLEGAAAILRPVAAELPGYVACQALLGAVEERRGNLPEAFEAYRAAAEVPAAAQRASELLAPATAALGKQVVDAAAKSRTEVAAAGLERLRTWAPDAEPTLEAERAVARARGDRQAELVALRRLGERRPTDLALRADLARLEAEAGDPAVAIRILDDLLKRDPGNAALHGELDDARFRWRLQLLPASVREATSRPQVTRADLALLLFWLVPDVRYGHPTSAHIATDVLDHPAREEIVRVVNLGLLDVDDTVHRFAPERGATRGDALTALTRILVRHQARCAAVGSGAPDPCGSAAGCGILASSAECLPATPLSGADAVRFIRRTLEATGER